MDKENLIELARSARENAYEPYSEFSVGAAILTESGDVFQGCNIENITLDMCSHAERTAMKTAIANGHRNFEMLAIRTQNESGAPPCGTCRQFLAEFCEDSLVILSDDDGSFSEYSLGEIFPSAFRPEHVGTI